VARVLKSQDRFDEARKLFEQTLEIQRRILGPEHPDTLRSMNSLANVLQNQGQLEEARALHEQALAILRRILGPEHPDTLGSMNNLAIVLGDQGQLEQARKLFEQTLEIQRRILGPEHPRTLGSMNNVAEMLSRQFKYDQARKLYEPALDTEQRVLPANHPQTLESMNGLVRMLLASPDASNHDRARALELARRAAGLHPGNRRCWNWLSVAEYRNGHWDAAIQSAAKSIELRGDDSPDFPLLVLALGHAQRGEMDQARQWYAEARPALEPGKTGDALRWLIDEARARLDVTLIPGDVRNETTPRAVNPPR
jgi:tetratricopeptide (TPR) repeat protein